MRSRFLTLLGALSRVNGDHVSLGMELDYCQVRQPSVDFLFLIYCPSDVLEPETPSIASKMIYNKFQYVYMSPSINRGMLRVPLHFNESRRSVFLAAQSTVFTNSRAMMLSSFLFFLLVAKRSKAITVPVAPYSFVGCWAEPSNVRALASVSYASDNMTLEYCAGLCEGIYKYWGVEYGREVDYPTSWSVKQCTDIESVIAATPCRLDHKELKKPIATCHV